ncbi:MAG: D-alanyl-D-alanine carboxypeptidase/D-alanyl-D-alanine-endopeptidase [Rhodobacteraceae bacterium]|nr:D-alanyl-D-alanine carboxypeptidase/D-alanyl-D-alanine-endopeptidase [Paracoccaceae bacterium]
MGVTGKIFSRRWVLGGLLSGIALPGAATVRPKARPGKLPQARETLATTSAPTQAAEALIAGARLGGQVGYLVVDAASGRVLESLGADVPLPPASVAKTLTTAYALETLGGDYRFSTRLIGTGPVTGGILQGDLVLVGGGDPTLSTDDLGDMAAALKAGGVHAVAGRFLVASGALPHVEAIDPSQPDQVDYNPGISGLNLNFNRVYFGWAKQGAGWALTMDARADRFNAPVREAQMAIVDREGPQYTYARQDGVESWTVAARALGKGGSRWLPVRAPGPYAGDVFQELAAAQGIVLAEPQMLDGTVVGSVLAEHRSGDLRAILREMLKYSTNVTAEIVGLTASVKRGGPVDSLATSAARMADWARDRFGISVTFYDHSGLGSQNRVTAADLVKLLRAATSDDLRGILKTIPLRDAKGNWVKNSPVQVQAKSGTLNFVSNLAGYETTAKGHELVFAILSGDVARCEAVPREDREAPYGVRSWIARAHALQQALLQRWAAVYDA